MENSSFLEGKILPALTRFAIPLMLSLVLQALYGAVDLVVVGHFGTTASVSAVATGSQVMQAITGIIVGLSTGVTVLIGQAMGAGDHKKAAKIVAGMVKLLIIVAFIITVIMTVFASYVARFMHIPIEAFDSTVSYLKICAGGTCFISAYNAISGIYRGIGNSKAPLLFIFIACVVNVVGDLFFVGVMGLDASGAAIATILAQAISVIFSLTGIKKGGLPFTIEKSSYKGNNSVFEILKIGSPIALQDFLTSVSFLIIMAIINSLGVVASASVGISEKLFVFLSIVPMSFMAALSAFVAQNVGARNFKRSDKSLFIATRISFCFGFLVFLLTFFGGDLLAMIFESNPQVIKATRLYLKSCSFEHLIISVSFCFLGYFNGRGKTSFVMAQGIFTAFAVRIPLSYYLSHIPNTNMFWIGLAVPISAAVSFVFCIIYFIILQKNTTEIKTEKCT